MNRLAVTASRLVVLALLGSACDDSHTTQPSPPPAITALTVRINPTNVLSGIVTFGATSGDSARIRYWSAAEPAAATPYTPVAAGLGQVTVLGFAPNTLYEGVLDVVGPGGTSSAAIEFQTDSLPAALRNVHLLLSGSGTPPSGYLLTSVTESTTAFAIAFDRAGVIRWYRAFPAQSGEHALACEQQRNGDFTLFVGASSGWQPVAGRYYEFTSSGDSVATYGAGADLYTDPHEVLVRSSGEADTAIHVLGYDLRAVDLTSLGGGPSQVVAGHSILRQSAEGTVLFQWSAWDHFTLDDWVARPPNLLQNTQLDFDHANSIELDPGGDYVVSFAAVTQIVKIDHASGAVRWRFGGKRNQFTLEDDTLNGFGIQHDVRLLENGDLLLFDNGNFHNPPESRAVEYSLDTVAMTATKVWEFRHSPPIFAPFVGSVQRFHNGHTLVGFGAAGIMTEVTPQGDVVWEGRLSVDNQPQTVFYRVRELPSLYLHAEP